MAQAYNQRYADPALWVDGAGGMIPPNCPVVGGNDVNGEPIYVGRTVHSGDTIPGKVVSSHRGIYVAHNGREHMHRNYQVLTNPNHANLAWVSAFGGQIPSGAMLGGQQTDGTPLYIGRAYYGNSMVIGKVHPRHQVLYAPFGGQEISIRSYEVLVMNNAQTNIY